MDRKWKIAYIALMLVLAFGMYRYFNVNSSNKQKNVDVVSVHKTTQKLIKGNINSKGEKIYHVPGGAYYDRTDAEEYFETEEDAVKAGYRRSLK